MLILNNTPVDRERSGISIEARSPLSRAGVTTVPTSGIDIVSIDLAPAKKMSVGERKQGWAQIGASTAVATFNAGVALGSSAGLGWLGHHFFGTVGAVAGAAAGLVGGLAVSAFGESNGKELPLVPFKRMAAIVGAQVGAAVSQPMQALFPNKVKEYQLSQKALQHKVRETDVKDFEKKLKPGDIILTQSDDDPMFHSIVSTRKKPMDFTHTSLYAGGGQILEANAETGKVGFRSCDSVLGGQTHAVAVRPHYQEGQAERVVEQAKSYVGSPYDWYLSLDDRRLGCVELPYHSIKNVTPEHQVPISGLWAGIEYIFPSDFLLTGDSEVVASTGIARPASKMRMTRYAWAAAGIGEER